MGKRDNLRDITTLHAVPLNILQNFLLTSRGENFLYFRALQKLTVRCRVVACCDVKNRRKPHIPGHIVRKIYSDVMDPRGRCDGSLGASTHQTTIQESSIMG